VAYSLSPQAAGELEDAFAWYLEHASPRVAAAFLDEFERAAGLVDRHPGLGTKTSNGRLVYPLRRYPYVLIYRVAAEGARIGAVAHERRGPRYRQQAVRRRDV
jgi:plasmid stabilization system protein ParE